VSPSFDDLDADHCSDDDENMDDSQEASVWQLLLLINPGDEEMALQQFADYRDAVAHLDEDDVVPIELASRWNISIDWGGDPHDDDFHANVDAASLFATAYDGLLEHDYTLWAWETEDDSYAGWMTLKRDNEHLRELAISLGINLRLGSEVT
jgi:hypothetical protein